MFMNWDSFLNPALGFENRDERRARCADEVLDGHWGRTSGTTAASGQSSGGAKSMIAPPRPRYPQADSQGTERLMVQVAMVAALVVIIYFIYKAQ